MSQAKSISLHSFLLMVFATGTGIMIIELVGPRLLAPSFGTSLTVWTSIITITLVSLAAGYEIGGRIADRWPTPEPLFWLIGMAGAWTALLPFLTSPVLSMTSGLGDVAGSLSSAGLLFLVPITLLAMVGPYVIRLITKAVQKVGSKVGTVTAISTVGSVTGSIATGFLLIPYVGLNSILYATAGILVAISCLGLITTRHRRALLPVVVLAGLGFASGHSGELLREASLAHEGLDILYERSTPYADIKVVDWDPRDERGESLGHQIRFLFIGLTSHTAVANGSVDLGYVRTMHLAATIRDDMKSACVVGLGGGSISRTLVEQYGMTVDSVEIDPWVVDAATKYFGTSESEGHRIHVRDGRRFLLESDRSFDLIVHDALGGGTAPYHLFSREMLNDTKARLNPGGVLAMNYLGFTEPPFDEGSASILATLRDAFSHVRVIRGDEPLQPEARDELAGLVGEDSVSFSNLVFFASDEPFELAPSSGLNAKLKEELDALLEHEIVLDVSHGQIITDQLNPLDRMHTHQNRVERLLAMRYFRPLFLGTPSS